MNTTYLKIVFFSISMASHCFASQPVLTKVSVQRQVLTIEPSPYIKETFLNNQNFTVTYDRTIAGLPETVLTIPYLMCISPVLWLSGKSYTIAQMDHDTYYALENIKLILKKFYPWLSFEGSLKPKRLINNSPPRARKGAQLALLFSGGLDCIAASLGLIGHDQLLITNQGIDMPLKNPQLFKNVEDQVRTFALSYGHMNALISCNFCTILNYEYLKVFSPKITKWWWLDDVTDAINHTSLTAPLLYSLGYQDLYIAASHTVDHPYPYGSHPLLDNQIRFAGIQVHHFQEELDRCQKIELITSASQLINKPVPALRVCWTDTEGNNCLSCEKCLRTLNNILVTGNIPFDYGFCISKEEAMHQTRVFLNSDPINTSKIFWEWTVIQNAARMRLNKGINLPEEDREYLTWLANIKLDGQHAEKIHKDDAQKDYFTWLWNAR